MTSTLSAKRRSASSSVYSALKWKFDTWLAGQSPPGSKMQVLNPRRAAATESMRPNWPPPRMPMVAPGERGSVIAWLVWNGGRKCSAPVIEALREGGVGIGKDRGGHQPGIGGPCRADRHGRNRRALWHLHDGISAVDARGAAARHGGADNRHAGYRRHHARQM